MSAWNMAMVLALLACGSALLGDSLVTVGALVFWSFICNIEAWLEDRGDAS